MCAKHNYMCANQYFLEQMKKIFVDRGVYKVVESFAEYLNHRYRNNCYNYSAAAIIGMDLADFLVRGSLTLKDSWMWEEGGYEHGWVEFTFNGEEYVFDSRCKGVVLKQDWYNEFKPERIVRFTKQEVLRIILTPENMNDLGNGIVQVKDTYLENDSNNLFNPFRKAKFYFDGSKIECFIAYKEFCN